MSIKLSKYTRSVLEKDTLVKAQDIKETRRNIQELINAIGAHTSSRGSDVHGTVNEESAGFVTPKILNDIDDITDKLAKIYSKYNSFVNYDKFPEWSIVLWNSDEKPPANWRYCDGSTYTDSAGNKTILPNLKYTIPVIANSDRPFRSIFSSIAREKDSATSSTTLGEGLTKYYIIRVPSTVIPVNECTVVVKQPVGLRVASQLTENRKSVLQAMADNSSITYSFPVGTKLKLGYVDGSYNTFKNYTVTVNGTTTKYTNTEQEIYITGDTTISADYYQWYDVTVVQPVGLRLYTNKHTTDKDTLFSWEDGHTETVKLIEGTQIIFGKYETDYYTWSDYKVNGERRSFYVIWSLSENTTIEAITDHWQYITVTQPNEVRITCSGLSDLPTTDGGGKTYKIKYGTELTFGYSESTLTPYHYTFKDFVVTKSGTSSLITDPTFNITLEDDYAIKIDTNQWQYLTIVQPVVVRIGGTDLDDPTSFPDGHTKTYQFQYGKELTFTNTGNDYYKFVSYNFITDSGITSSVTGSLKLTQDTKVTASTYIVYQYKLYTSDSTFTVPAGITRIRVGCVAGGGGGFHVWTTGDYGWSYDYLKSYAKSAGSGTDSSIIGTSINLACVGGGGAIIEPTETEEWKSYTHITKSEGGTAGTPNGTAGTLSKRDNDSIADHSAVNLLLKDGTTSVGSFGKGGGAGSPGNDDKMWDRQASGGSGGYQIDKYYLVTAGETYTITVGKGGKGSECTGGGTSYANDGGDGAVLIEWGKGI